MSNNHKIINGIKYDRSLLEVTEHMAETFDHLTSDFAEHFINEILGGEGISEIKQRTIHYILDQHDWGPRVRAHLKARGPEFLALGAAAPSDPEIRSLLHIEEDGTIPGNKLVIDGSTLASIDSKGLITKFLLLGFDNRPITISEAKANASSDGPDVVIKGKGGFRLMPNSVPIELTLSMADGNVQALAVLTMIGSTPPANPWKFSDSFEKLPTVVDISDPVADATSPLDSLIMRNAQFLLTTRQQEVDGQQLTNKALNFRADMTPTGILSVFETILKHKSSLPLKGTVLIPVAGSNFPALTPFQFPWELSQKPIPGINLAAALSLDDQILGKMKFGVHDFHIYSAHSAEWLEKNDTYETTIAYSGDFKVPSAHINIPAVAITPPGVIGAKIALNLSHSPLGHLSDLVDLVGIDNLADEFKGVFDPDDGPFADLGVQGVSATFEYSSGSFKVSAVTADVGMPRINWSVWPSTFEVNSVVARFEVKNPFVQAKREIEVTIDGKVKVYEKPVDIVAKKAAGFQVIATMPDGFEVPLADLINKYASGEGIKLPKSANLDIDTLQLVVAPKSYFSFMLLMAQQSAWEIPLGVAKLAFSNINLFFLKPAHEPLAGNVAATATIAGVNLSINYDLPGDILIKGRFPTVQLSDLVKFLLGKDLEIIPDAFDLTFTQSYILMKKKASDYKLDLGTVIKDIGSLALVLEKKTKWGLAFGLQLNFDQMDKLPGIGKKLDPFLKLVPIDSLTLAVSTLDDDSFSFPGFQTFNQPSLGSSKINLPQISNGIQRGFYLFSETTFKKEKGGVVKLLMELLKIPENTSASAFFKYLATGEEFQFGFALTTFLTPVGTDPSCSGDAGYKNSCFNGMLLVTAGGANGFSFDAIAKLKTELQGHQIEFDIVISLVENGFFISCTEKSPKPISFGPFEVGNIAIELGITFEGLPSFGFSAELEAAGIDSSLAVLVNTENPAESMVAGALSNLTLGGIIDTFLKAIDEPVPAPVKKVLDTISISGPKEGSFVVDAADAFITALNDYKGSEISSVFSDHGIHDFPVNSPELMIFNARDHDKWFITEQQAGSVVTHWQIEKDGSDKVKVSKEAQFYFVPVPAGINIGTLHYNAGFMVSGAITFLGFELDIDVVIDQNKGFKADACMDRISFLDIPQLFSIEANVDKEFPKNACGDDSGPQVSICTYTQDDLPAGTPDKYKLPHFFINGKLTMLGSSWGIFADINKEGASLELDISRAGGAFTGSLTGDFSKKGFDLGGQIFIGIPDIDLGLLGNWKIKTGVEAGAIVFAHINDESFGASFSLAFDLDSEKHEVGTLKLDVKTDKFVDLVEKVFDEVKDFLWDLFIHDAKKWAEYVVKILKWAPQELLKVLMDPDLFDLSEEQAYKIISALSGFCPIVTAATALI